MSATDQFPPRYLLDEDGAQPSASTSNQSETRPADDAESNGAKQQLYLPAPEPVGEGKQGERGGAARTLDVSTGGKVALDELGPMVVNKDGTLSRIHNWAGMTEAERARTLRVLGARNQIRMAEIRRGEGGEGGTQGAAQERKEEER